MKKIQNLLACVFFDVFFKNLPEFIFLYPFQVSKHSFSFDSQKVCLLALYTFVTAMRATQGQVYPESEVNSENENNCSPKNHHSQLSEEELGLISWGPQQGIGDVQCKLTQSNS